MTRLHFQKTAGLQSPSVRRLSGLLDVLGNVEYDGSNPRPFGGDADVQLPLEDVVRSVDFRRKVVGDFGDDDFLVGDEVDLLLIVHLHLHLIPENEKSLLGNNSIKHEHQIYHILINKMKHYLSPPKPNKKLLLDVLPMDYCPI